MTQTIAEKIQQRRLQILVHSCIYYEFDTNIIDDHTYNGWAHELAKLQEENPDISKKGMYADAFKKFDGSTGFDLPKDDWVKNKAKQLLNTRCEKKQPKSQGKLRLF